MRPSLRPIALLAAGAVAALSGCESNSQNVAGNSCAGTVAAMVEKTPGNGPTVSTVLTVDVTPMESLTRVENGVATSLLVQVEAAYIGGNVDVDVQLADVIAHRLGCVAYVVGGDPVKGEGNWTIQKSLDCNISVGIPHEDETRRMTAAGFDLDYEMGRNDVLENSERPWAEIALDGFTQPVKVGPPFMSQQIFIRFTLDECSALVRGTDRTLEHDVTPRRSFVLEDIYVVTGTADTANPVDTDSQPTPTPTPTPVPVPVETGDTIAVSPATGDTSVREETADTSIPLDTHTGVR
jgi:hypothetical protein